jgi:hypothetical protein
VTLFTSLKLVRLKRLKASKMSSSPIGLSALKRIRRPTLKSVLKNRGPRPVLRPTVNGRSLLLLSRLTSIPVRMLKGKPLRAVTHDARYKSASARLYRGLPLPPL